MTKENIQKEEVQEKFGEVLEKYEELLEMLPQEDTSEGVAEEKNKHSISIIMGSLGKALTKTVENLGDVISAIAIAIEQEYPSEED